MSEIWRDVAGYEGHYQVSDRGRVRSLYRIIRQLSKWGKLCSRKFPGRHLHLTAVNGYLRVRLCKQGRDQVRLVHRLVLEAFVGPCPPGYEACHNDGRPANNQVTNLRWDSVLANKADMIRHGTSARGERNGSAKLTENQVREIRRLYEEGTITQPQLAKLFGVSHMTVRLIISRKHWSHVQP